MHFAPLLHISILLLATQSTASPLSTRNDKIKWGPCEFESLPTVVCGNLTVPLDYQDSNSNKTFQLQLLKIPALSERPLGSILYNCGGPGYDCRVGVGGSSIESYLNITGGKHDIITWDPRGTGKTLPFTCFPPEESPLAGLLYPTPSRDISDIALGTSWANAQILANRCYDYGREIGSLIGTAYTARDMMQIVDALDEDGLLRFWGTSYGTTLGVTVAAMFPERMDRLLLDAVVNSHNYYHQHSIDVDQFLGLDEGLRSVLTECIAAGPKCALSAVNSTALELEATLWRLLEDIRLHPLVAGPLVVDRNILITTLDGSLRQPSIIPKVLTLFYHVLNGNITAVSEYFQASLGTGGGLIETLPGIKCGDSDARTSNLADIERIIGYTVQSSRWYGDSITGIASICAQWRIDAKERYSGDFKVQTRNPILFMGTTYDPATSIPSAYNMSATFNGSVVVEQVGYGHGIMGQTSACTTKIASDYFVNGTIPENGTKCQVETQLFS